MRSEKIRFPNDEGVELAAVLETPDHGEPTAFAIFAHCFTCTKDYKAPVYVSRALAAAGIAVLRFDFAGLGESEGEFAATTFSSNVADLVAAARYLAEEHGPPRLLLGHSFGGAAVLDAAHRIDSVVAVVTIAAPSSPDFVLRHLELQRQRLETHGEAEIEIAGRSFRLRRSFVEDLGRDRPPVSDLGRALLILHSPADATVGIDQAAALFAAAGHPKSFVSLDRADHLLSRPEDARWVAGIVAAWVHRYLD